MTTTWSSRTPLTYEIGYGTDHVGNDEFRQQVAAARPGILHTGHDVPLNSATGNTVQFTPLAMHHISAGEIPGRIAELQEFVREMHAAGAKYVIPYIITMLFIGNHEERTGFWQLYDRWEEFSSIGLGPKPDTDPVEWLQTERRPFGQHKGLYAYETTVAHPDVQRYLRVCVDLLARCGYDGVFLDVNTMIGQTEHDRQWFSAYLKLIYSEAELSSLFGFSCAEEVRLGNPGEGFLWVETQRFRAWAFGQLFSRLCEAGRARVPHFFVLPNASPMSSIDAFYQRRVVGHGLDGIAQGCELFMYEEMQQAGRFGMDRIADNILQYKTALAHQMTPVVLLYHANDPDAIALANAEAAAGGGGAFVQPGFFDCDTMRFWGEWFRRHADRYEALNSLHDVGVLFFLDEMYWDNLAHVDAVYRIRQALSDNHILFDLIVDPQLSLDALRSFALVVVPHVGHLGDRAVQSLRDYAAQGGRVVLIGKCGAYDERGAQRQRALRDGLASAGDAVLWVDTVDALIPRRAPELFDLTEDDYNNIETVTALPDRVSSVEQAQAARRVPLVAALEMLAGRPLPVVTGPFPYTVRLSAFRDPFADRTIVHLVNYDLPVIGKGRSGPPIPARDLRLRIASSGAVWWTPDGVEGEPLSVRGDEVVVPEVRIYALVELRDR